MGRRAPRRLARRASLSRRAEAPTAPADARLTIRRKGPSPLRAGAEDENPVRIGEIERPRPLGAQFPLDDLPVGPRLDVRGHQTPDPRLAREPSGPDPVHVNPADLIGLSEAHLGKQQIDAASALENRRGLIGVPREEERNPRIGIALGGPLDARAEGLDRMHSGEGREGHRTDPVGSPRAHREDRELAGVVIGEARAVDLTDALHRADRPRQEQRPQVRPGAPAPMDLQGDDVPHVIGMRVRQDHRIQVARIDVAPQRPEGSRPELQRDVPRPHFARHRIRALGLDEIARGRRRRTRHRTRRTDDRQPHAPVSVESIAISSTRATSGPKKRRARRGKDSPAPVVRKRCEGDRPSAQGSCRRARSTNSL